MKSRTAKEKYEPKPKFKVFLSEKIYEKKPNKNYIENSKGIKTNHV